MEIEFSISVKNNNKIITQKYAGHLPNYEEKQCWIKISGETLDEINKKFLSNCYAVLAKARNPENQDEFEKDLVNYKNKLFPL